MEGAASSTGLFAHSEQSVLMTAWFGLVSHETTYQNTKNKQKMQSNMKHDTTYKNTIYSMCSTRSVWHETKTRDRKHEWVKQLSKMINYHCCDEAFTTRQDLYS